MKPLLDKYVAKCFDAVDRNHDIKKATLFITSTLTVVVTRQRRDKRQRSHTYLVTVGKPNWANTQKIKQYAKAKVTLPLKKPLLTYYPASKKTK